jgi:hypothetical protein
MIIPSSGALQGALDEFRVFYSHVRPHQNLHGPTDIWQMPVKEVTQVQALAGLMCGYWIRR